MAPELEGDFPFTKVKYFEVYLTCTQILEDIARVLQDAPENDPKRDTFPAECLHELSGILPMADECVELKGGKRLFCDIYAPTIEIVKAAIPRAIRGQSSRGLLEFIY